MGPLQVKEPLAVVGVRVGVWLVPLGLHPKHVGNDFVSEIPPALTVNDGGRHGSAAVWIDYLIQVIKQVAKFGIETYRAFDALGQGKAAGVQL